jgi:PIN domain nuclease of toxin-antitoxin system
VRVLADTHALVWAINSPELLSRAAFDAFKNEEIVASVASLWELSLKSGKKNSLIDDPLPWWRKYITGHGVATLAIRVADVIELSSLAQIHKDPIDRILVAQSLSEGISIVTRDERLARYGVPTIW